MALQYKGVLEKECLLLSKSKSHCASQYPSGLVKGQLV